MRDWVPRGEMSFLAGDSEMARLIRSFDWSRHPFGPLETWPQSLRSALSICLHSAFPTAIYWGPELRLLYNDAWAPIPGPRHPDALGRPAHEVWSDIWPVIEPQLAGVLETGEGLFVENQMLPMARFGAPEETYWSYSFTAIRGEDGRIAGVFNSGNETTVSVRSERQMRFLLDYAEALRGAESREEARRLALSMLGEHLGVDRVGIAETSEDPDRVAISGEWVSPALRPLDHTVTLSQFGPAIAEGLHAGRSVICDDVLTDDRFGESSRTAFARLEVRSFVALPWRIRGRMVGAVYIHCRTPRDWSDFDITTVQGLLERTRAWIEADRAAEREQIMVREIDHRARNVLAVAQSVVRLTNADDIPTFRKKIDERIAALARAHSLLSAQHWHAIELGDLVSQELAPYTAAGDGTGVRVDGPQVSLPADLAQTMALIVHELATNAAKHGALAAADGRLDVRWRLDAARVLVLEWIETVPGGLTDAPEEQGFGSVLLGRVIQVQLGGKLETEFAAEGFRARVRLPLGGDGAEAAAGGGTPRGASVLVVEAETVVALDLEARLQGMGHEVAGVCGTVEAAKAVLTRRRPDVAMVDTGLRGGTSVEFARDLAAEGVRVILLADQGSESDVPRDLTQLPVLVKPFDEARLREALARRDR